jgi:hypothetical protein
MTEGHTWKRPEVHKDKVLERNMILKENAPALWDKVLDILENAVDKGQLKVV